MLLFFTSLHSRFETGPIIGAPDGQVRKNSTESTVRQGHNIDNLPRRSFVIIFRVAGNSFQYFSRFRARFFKKIQDWILKSERIRKRILRFFTQQINPRSLGSWCIKGTEESTPRVDSSAPLRHLDPKDLGLIC